MDNSAAMIQGLSGTMPKLSRHIGAKYRYVRELITLGEVMVLQIESAFNRADGFTKCLTPVKYNAWLSRLMSPLEPEVVERILAVTEESRLRGCVGDKSMVDDADQHQGKVSSGTFWKHT